VAVTGLFGAFAAAAGQLGLFLVFVLVVFVLRPLTTLVHELGHGVAVAQLAQRRARIEVFGFPTLSGRLGLLDLRVGLVPAPGRVAGVCVYATGDLRWRTRGWIALCGPLASLGQLVLLLATSPLWLSAAAPIRASLVISGWFLVAFVLSNLLPTHVQTRQQPRLARDGWTARECFANDRAGVPPVRTRASQRPGVNPVPPRVDRIRADQPTRPSSSGRERTLADIWATAADPSRSSDS
jgi:hypothetical protein